MGKSERQATVFRSHTRTNTHTLASASASALSCHRHFGSGRQGQGRVFNHGGGWRQKKKRGRAVEQMGGNEMKSIGGESKGQSLSMRSIKEG
jgi:hypothetical protein